MRYAEMLELVDKDFPGIVYSIENYQRIKKLKSHGYRDRRRKTSISSAVLVTDKQYKKNRKKIKKNLLKRSRFP
ncbi:unnamed protein product [marine sediment metagenome]|uniref:Uncharacterized protein n=1 Tax=marine sediment metagenome TaxID=412755 RepID=X1EG82_9ZZZZ